MIEDSMSTVNISKNSSVLKQDMSFGIIPLKKKDKKDVWEVFIIQHKAGHWGFPKGHKAYPEEQPKETAQRELKEETGLDIYHYLLEESISESYTCISHGKHVQKKVTYFLAYVQGEITLCPQEVTQGLWIAIDKIFEKIPRTDAKHHLIDLLKKIVTQV